MSHKKRGAPLIFRSSEIDTLERLGLGTVMIKYDQSNDNARKKAEELSKRFDKKAVITVPVPPGQLQSRTAGGAYGLEVVETPTAGIEAVELLKNAFETKIERFVVGQLLPGVPIQVCGRISPAG